MGVGPNWHSGAFRVKPYRPVRNAVIAIAVVAALVAGSWWLYQRGRTDGGYDARMARATEAHLRIDIEQLRQRIGQLKRRNTLLERVDRIDRDAITHLREEIEARERRIDALQEELAFYRNLVSPSDTGPGLNVRRLKLVPVPGNGRRFRIELVLTQLNSDDRHVEGRVDLSLTGDNEGEEQSLVAEELLVDGESNMNFRFKYFQTLGGVIELPQEFVPARLQLKVVPAGGRLDAIEEDYSWNSLISEGA